MSLNFLNVFRSRRSIGEYLPREVSNEVPLQILEAGRWAPSAHNLQPWRFIVIQDSATKQRLAKVMVGRWNENISRNGVTKEQRESLINVSVELFENASIIVIACLIMEDMNEYLDERRKKIESVMAVQSVAAAIQNILLRARAARGEGLGSCWFCAPLFCQDVVRTTLKIPKKLDPQALMTLGYPANRRGAPPRKPLEEIVHENRWGQAS